jgi:propanol-preferring alcohol dehydrogenase
MQMRCYCVTGHGQPLELVQRDTPQPKGTEVLVRVKAGLCHSDLHIWEGYYDLGGGRSCRSPIAASSCRSRSAMKSAANCRGGPRCRHVKTGTVAVVHPWIGCGVCAACQRGEENLHEAAIAWRDARRRFRRLRDLPHPRYLVDLSGLDPAGRAARLRG